MNCEAIGAVGEILGSIAVLVTLVYLALHIRQNTLTSRAAMHHQIATEYNRLHEITMAHPHMAEVYARAGFTEGDAQTHALAYWLANRCSPIQTEQRPGQSRVFRRMRHRLRKVAAPVANDCANHPGSRR